jgi:phytoene dehydrogenase-like protein
MNEIAFLPSEVDGVFIGGGHNSLVCAAYLAKAGLRVAVLEASSQIGGGTTTDEVTLPGFRHNLHAYFVRWTPEYEVWRDLDLGRHGASSIFPEVQNALPFDHGQRALVTYQDLDRSIAEIRRLSAADADNYRRLHAEFTDLTRRIDSPLRLAHPIPPDELIDLMGRSRSGHRFLELDRESPLDVVCNAFESEPLRALILFNVAVRGYLPNLDVVGLGSIVALALSNSHGGRIVEGGTYAVVQALARSLADKNGLVATNAEVASIDVVGGRATGVTLTDGRKVRAKRFVASGVPAPMTMLELVGPSHLEAGLAGELAGYRWLEEALFGVHWALGERPRFAAEAYNPDVPRALNLALGYESSADLTAHMMAIRAAANTNDAPIHASVPTIHDPTQAPPNMHTTFGWHFVPGPSTRGKWDAAAGEERAAAVIDTYSRYAPNLPAATLALTAHSPDDTEQRVGSMRGGDRHHGSYHPSNWGWNRPSPLMPGYRTPIAALYLCGASQHPGGSFHGQPGYNAASVIADDLGLEKWWSPGDARKALADLS